MKAEYFYKTIIRKIKTPTDRKIYNRAKKHGLKDTFAEILYWTGLTVEKCKEFTT